MGRVYLFNDWRHIAIYPVIFALMSSAAMRADAATACLPDNAMVEMTGVIKQVTDRDKHTDQPYSYFTISTERAYCLSGPDVDERSSTPTHDMTVLPRTGVGDRQAFGPYVGYRVMATGRLSSSNFGGPQLLERTIRRIARDD